MPKTRPPLSYEPAPPTGEIILYQTDDGRTRVECRFVDETLWLSQALIAELFQVTVPTVNEHLKNILDEGEVTGPTIRKFRIVRREGPCEVEREIEPRPSEAVRDSAKQALTLAKAQGSPRKQTSFSLRASRLCENIAFFYSFSGSDPW